MPDRIATSLLRIARNPASGRVGHGNTLDIGLRAGLFADLALAGAVISNDAAPLAIDIGTTGDRFLDAVARAVAGRPGVSWPRWYRHVHDDRTALIGDLVEHGRWVRRSRIPARYDDVDQPGAIELAEHANAVAVRRTPPRDAADAVLGTLCAICGAVDARPRPRAMRDELRPLLDEIGVPEDPIRITVQHALFSAASTVRRARTGRGPVRRALR